MRFRLRLVKAKAAVNNQHEPHRPQRRRIHDSAFASALILGFGPLGIILTVAVGVWIGVFEGDAKTERKSDNQPVA